MPPRRQNPQAVPAKRRPLRTRPGGLFVVSPSTRANEPEVVFLRADWIFFDVGSTLIDETAAYNRRALEMLRGTDVSFAAFDRKRAEFFAQGLDGNSEAVRFFGLTKTPWHPEDKRPFPNARETLAFLKRAGYRLGIIANQSPGVAQRLAALGLLPFLDAIASSGELGVSKPDPRIFEAALATAHCPPPRAVMVDDRLDNDIRPAKSIGMKPVWLRNGFSVSQGDTRGPRCADLTIAALSELKSLFAAHDGQ